MHSTQSSSHPLPLDLGDGLILRRSSAADAERLAAFNGWIHGPQEENAPPEEGVAVWTHDLLSRPHPTFHPDDFTIVEDTRSGKIVSSLNLISQTWSYAGIPFGVGRPELVGTDPAYRNRGLVRKQFEIIHAWSAERGELAQAITGIPFYYRLFGYEMAPNLGGGRNVYESQIRPLKEGTEEPYLIRPASEADLGEIMICAAEMEKREPLTCRRDQDQWRYEISGKSEKNINRAEIYMIEDRAGQVVGFFGASATLWGRLQAVLFYQLKPGVSYLAVTPVLLRFAWALGQQRSQEKEPCNAVGLRLNGHHPAYCALEIHNAPPIRPYAYYLRVPDLPGFLYHIKPVLEERLEHSACAGHSTELKISFYRGGIKIVLEKGKITAIEPHSEYWEKCDAAFPDLTFLQMVFQYRSMEELRTSRPDAWARLDAHALLDAMFPRSDTNVWCLS